MKKTIQLTFVIASGPRGKTCAASSRRASRFAPRTLSARRRSWTSKGTASASSSTAWTGGLPFASTSRWGRTRSTGP